MPWTSEAWRDTWVAAAGWSVTDGTCGINRLSSNSGLYVRKRQLRGNGCRRYRGHGSGRRVGLPALAAGGRCDTSDHQNPKGAELYEDRGHELLTRLVPSGLASLMDDVMSFMAHIQGLLQLYRHVGNPELPARDATKAAEKAISVPL